MILTERTQSVTSWTVVSANVGRLCVGDTVHDYLKDGRRFTAEVVAINPYEPNTAVFVFRDIIERKPMNLEWTNSGGWRDCEVRRYLNDEFFAILPDDLQEAIRLRVIKQRLNGFRAPVVTADKLWLPSHTEVFGDNMPCDVDDVQFEWFRSEKNRIKVGSADTPANWWERSPYYNYSNNFCSVKANGSATYAYAYYSSGVAPAFLI